MEPQLGASLCPTLPLRRKSLKLWELVGACHPRNSLGGLDMTLHWQRIGVVQRAGLNINDSG